MLLLQQLVVASTREMWYAIIKRVTIEKKVYCTAFLAKLCTCKLLISIKIDCQINQENLILWWNGGCEGWKKIDKPTSERTLI